VVSAALLALVACGPGKTGGEDAAKVALGLARTALYAEPGSGPEDAEQWCGDLLGEGDMAPPDYRGWLCLSLNASDFDWSDFQARSFEVIANENVTPHSKPYRRFPFEDAQADRDITLSFEFRCGDADWAQRTVIAALVQRDDTWCVWNFSILQ